jgi:hypothetical protein
MYPSFESRRESQRKHVKVTISQANEHDPALLQSEFRHD